MKHIAGRGQVHARGHYEYPVGFESHALLDLQNRHFGDRAEELRQQMRVLERPMRCDHKGHPGVSREAAENVHIGLQPPGRTAQTHHAKIIGCGACLHSFPV